MEREKAKRGRLRPEGTRMREMIERWPKWGKAKRVATRRGDASIETAKVGQPRREAARHEVARHEEKKAGGKEEAQRREKGARQQREGTTGCEEKKAGGKEEEMQQQGDGTATRPRRGPSSQAFRLGAPAFEEEKKTVLGVLGRHWARELERRQIGLAQLDEHLTFASSHPDPGLARRGAESREVILTQTRHRLAAFRAAYSTVATRFAETGYH
ncbi:hypothetical protein BOTBODRAFT_643523 [Botryobasidium botryosum FD-172 SS1]|uniref:Uncharacterized protein n=1 Tax=Botryobasidium botryosum (strain FD-172 SS1) TaxID=930990 RepID=A0A067M2Q9_BOTB1|nr:hypothetical protein BOTBODRAFT_643523 [Botryobasidium botryosum FD-172 SS1]